MPRRALITGGEGRLARSLRETLLASGRFDEVLAPGRAELDVTRAEEIRDYFSGIDGLDLLINNAGTLRDSPLLKLSEGDWEVVQSTNLRGAFLCSREAIRLMFRARTGHIVNVGSFSALRPPPGQAAYAAAKAGLIGLTQALAEEVGKRGVRVNCVLPGFLEDTGMTRGLPPEVIERARHDHTLGRFNSPEDAAAFIDFLDGRLGAVSGQVFQLDSRLRRW